MLKVLSVALMCSVLTLNIFDINPDKAEIIISEKVDLPYIYPTIETEATLTKLEKNDIKTKESNPIILEQSELEVLQRIVEAECGGQSEEAKINVANVILNRTKHNSFPDTVEGVVFQKNQFSPVGNKMYYKVEVTEETISAVDSAINNEDTTNGALYFCNKSLMSGSSSNWFDRNLEYIFKDDSGHSFYK